VSGNVVLCLIMSDHLFNWMYHLLKHVNISSAAALRGSSQKYCTWFPNTFFLHVVVTCLRFLLFWRLTDMWTKPKTANSQWHLGGLLKNIVPDFQTSFLYIVVVCLLSWRLPDKQTKLKIHKWYVKQVNISTAAVGANKGSSQ
jgi:hypothetical protein